MLEKIIQNLNAKQLKEFATDNGWSEEILTTTESPNYYIPNPVHAKEFLRDKFNAPVLEAYKSFKLKSARQTAEEKIKLAQAELEQAQKALSIDEIIM